LEGRGTVKKHILKAAPLNDVLRELLDGRYENIPDDPVDIQDDETAALVCTLAKRLKEVNDFAAQLAKGNLSAPAPPRENLMAMGLKKLQANLRHLNFQQKQVAKGDFTQTIDYMGDLSEGFNWMAQQLKQRKEQLDYELSHDVTTGLLNRHAFTQRIQDMIRAAPNATGAMVCMGIDNLKYINNSYGYELGDKYLLAAAQVFSDATDGQALLARISGNEFAVYFHGHNDTKSVIERATLCLMQNPEVIIDEALDESITILTSKGVAVYPDDTEDVFELIKYSTHAMYQVKHSDRGSIGRFDNAIYQRNAELYTKLEALTRLIDNRAIRFAFQPIVDLSNGSIFGYEALMRPTTKDFSSPLEILKTAEIYAKLPQIEQLTYEVIFQWISEHISEIDGKMIFFNTVSADYFTPDKLRSVHSEYRKCIPHMIFEILESAADENAFAGKIESLRRSLGLKVAIDDYGAGYSNDFRLLNLAPNILKVDRFFIHNIDTDEDKQMIMSNLISFCAAKGIKMLAEGVETKEELAAVCRLGFDYAQGFYLGKPKFTLQTVNTRRLRIGSFGHSKSMPEAQKQPIPVASSI